MDNKDSLKITKSVSAPLAFLQHHLTYKFTENIKPIHLMFNFYSTNIDTEDTNLRLLNENVCVFNYLIIIILLNLYE